jgi:hypothetical protein
MAPFWSAIPLVGKVIDGVVGLVDEAIEDKDEANKLKAQLTTVFAKADMSKFSTQIQAQANVIMAEANSESWLARNWRPILMMVFTFIVFNNYVLVPWLGMVFTKAPILAIPVQMWDLLKLGVSGYIVGRSGEKMVTAWKAKRD